MKLDTSLLLAADAALNLGVLPIVVANRLRVGTDQIPAGFSAENLTDRRNSLLESWVLLHTLLSDEEPPEAVSPNALRAPDGLEEEAFANLAEELLLLSDADQALLTAGLGAGIERVPTHNLRRPAATSAPTAAKAVVLGAGVMDTIFRIRKQPLSDRSVQVDKFALNAGGKGLTQAVGCARLGMHTDLIAALGMKHFGQDIVDYLETEQVGTNLILREPKAMPPVVGVIILRDGSSTALGWKNEQECSLRPEHILDEERRSAISQADVLLLTFEPPAETVEATLDFCASLGHRKPTVILTPAPPYDARGISQLKRLASVDFLVANSWEAQLLVGDEDAAADVNDVAQQLIAMGVGTTCIFTQAACFVHRRDLKLAVPPLPTPRRNSAGARDAFCAALALKHFENDGVFSAESIHWANAAMSTSTASEDVPDSMPTREEVERLIRVFELDAETSRVDV
jgi:ribokinase